MSMLDAIGLTRKITRPRIEAFLQRYATGEKTLDVGCGTALYGKYFPNRTTLEIAPRPGVQVDIVADVHHLPMITENSFPVVLCTEVLEHLHSPEQALRELRRILIPGGLLLLTTRFIYPLHDTPGDFYRFTKYGLRHLLRDFEIVELHEEASTIETLAILYQRIGFQTDTLGLRPLKLLWFLKAKCTLLFHWLLSREFGDIGHKKEERNILCSGYYVAARKRSV